MDLEVEVNKFVETILANYKVKKVRDQKAIHERVWGTNLYLKHEIALLDTPLIQRLRRIFQTGLVFLTYPSSLHTRFDHTLGCISLVSRFVHRLKERTPQTDIYIDDNPEKGDLAELRMAALLHDCGHAFFSHVSEHVYQRYPEMTQFSSSDEFTHCKAHEIL
ncbi:HD domain-containing protein, partial [Patescibacteria group bacterium]